MLCPDCKTRVPDKYTYCPNCGASVPLYRVSKRKRLMPVLGGVLTVNVVAGALVFFGIQEHNAQQMRRAAETKAENHPAAANAAIAEGVLEIGTEHIQKKPAAHVDLAALTPVSVTPAEPDDLQLGDINGDGVVTPADSRLVMLDYTQRLNGGEGILTDAQRARAHCRDVPMEESCDLNDAHLILLYATSCIGDDECRALGMAAWLADYSA